MKRQSKFVAAIVVGMLTVTGCGTMTANNKDLQKARLHLEAGDLAGALAAEQKRKDLCGMLDRGVLYQLQGNAVASNGEFDKALALIKTYEDRALVSAQEVGRGAGSVLVNDKTLEYQGEGFEKVIIHALKARNYLMLGDHEGARVEIRNANMRQDEERKRHSDEIESAKKEAEEKSYNFDDRVNSSFASMSSVLARVDNAYQNPFATYLSGVVYELNGELDDAFIDFRKAYEMIPNELIGRELARLAAKLHRQDEVASLRLPAADGSTGGDTLVLLDNGLAPAKGELKFPVPAGRTMAAVALPISQPIPTDLAEAVILDDAGHELGRTSMMVDIEAMSVRNLRDRYPAILTRQTIRLAAKIAASNAAVAAANQQSAQAGLIVQLVSSVGNIVTEQADLRAWYQLPRSIHVARLTLPPGTREVTVRLVGLSGQPLGDFRAPVSSAGGTMKLVGLRYLKGRTMAWTPSSDTMRAAAPPLPASGEAVAVAEKGATR